MQQTPITTSKKNMYCSTLDAVCAQFDIPLRRAIHPIWSGYSQPSLDHWGQLKLIGEYEETIGTCLIFSENEEEPLVHEETGTSDANLFKGACIVDPYQGH
ncbi:General transcription factor 3C polypeptide 6 [Bienertia sinuspersici]